MKHAFHELRNITMSPTPGATESVAVLLSSDDPQKLLRGLKLVKKELASASEAQARTFFEMISPLFHIDLLDHPDLAPVVDEAVSTTADFGNWVVPVLMEKMDAGDLKAQIAAAHALGKMGVQAIDPLTSAFRSTDDPERRSFVLYALGKIKAPEVARVLPLALEGAVSGETELRDTAIRALGKFAEVIRVGQLSAEDVKSITNCLTACFADNNPGIRAKAVRSMGKLAKFGHLKMEEKLHFAKTCNLFLGTDDKYEWDRAFIVRKEAQEALKYCSIADENK